MAACLDGQHAITACEAEVVFLIFAKLSVEAASHLAPYADKVIDFAWNFAALSGYEAPGTTATFTVLQKILFSQLDMWLEGNSHGEHTSLLPALKLLAQLSLSRVSESRGGPSSLVFFVAANHVDVRVGYCL